MGTILRTVLLGAGLPLVGCGALGSLANLSATSAPNPLESHSALSYSKDPQGIPFEGQKACTTWPIHDSMNVNVTESQICVEGTIYRLADTMIDGSQTTQLSVGSDGSVADKDKGGLIGQSAKSFEAHPKKTGSCFDKTRSVNVWEASYHGCVPNTDTNGKPVVTKGSTYLAVGPARWKFPGAAAPADSTGSATPTSAPLTSK